MFVTESTYCWHICLLRVRHVCVCVYIGSFSILALERMLHLDVVRSYAYVQLLRYLNCIASFAKSEVSTPQLTPVASAEIENIRIFTTLISGNPVYRIQITAYSSQLTGSQLTAQ
jgi:hypothetical protein